MYQDSEDQDHVQQGEKPRGYWMFAVLAGLVVILLFYTATRLSGGGFDAAPYVFQLAQDTQAYRQAHAKRTNYCNFLVVLEDTQGKETVLPGIIYDGYGKETNEEHCEQKSLRFVRFNIFPGLFSRHDLRTLRIIVFSQVTVCQPCKESLSTLHQELQQLIKQHGDVTVEVFVWHIRPRSAAGFNPAIYPAGPFTDGPPRPRTNKPRQVTKDDLQQVYPQP